MISRTTARAAARSGALWGYVFGAFVVSTAWSYTSIYPTLADREALAHAFGHNSATIALFGPAPDLQTVGGFVVLKVSMTTSLIAAVWGLLTGTRLLRGEEDAGRWDLMLAGSTTPRRATAQALGGLGAGALVLWALSALVVAVGGRWSRIAISPGAALFLALAFAVPAVVFLAVGSVTSQLTPTRGRATGWAAAVLGVSYGLRMVGDAGLGLHALTWLSPLGWVEELNPLTGADPVPLAPIFALTAALAGAAVVMAGVRDVGTGVFPDRTHAIPRLRWLGGQLGLSARLARGTVGAWILSLAVVGTVFGLVAEGAGTTLTGSSVRDVLDKLGATGGGTGAYLGVTFLMCAVLMGFAAAGQIGAVRAEESRGWVDHLLVQPLARTRWLSGRIGIAAALVVACGVVAGLFTWLGAASQHTGFGLGQLLAAGVNAAAPALFLLGVGTLLVGLWPRAALGGVYAVLGWSVLVELVGAIGALSRGLLDTSVFHLVASAPASPVDWTPVAALLGCAAVAGVVGAASFTRRDIGSP